MICSPHPCLIEDLSLFLWELKAIFYFVAEPRVLSKKFVEYLHAFYGKISTDELAI